MRFRQLRKAIIGLLGSHSPADLASARGAVFEKPAGFPALPSDLTLSDRGGAGPLSVGAAAASFFVIGCARSGTTSLCKILDKARNGVCLLEPVPNLNFETREAMEGRLREPYKVLLESIGRRAVRYLDQGVIYGEKNVTLGSFIPYLSRLMSSRFVFVKREGRDVVRSLLNWHNQMFGTVYRECKEEGELTERARAAANALPVEQDLSDYSRPRPQPNDIWYERWASFSRLEMCSWYWSRTNELMLDHLDALPSNRWIQIDYTAPQAPDVLQVAEFLGLEGLDAAMVEGMLDSRINSLDDRIREAGRFPRWPDWSSLDRVRFECIAARTMQRLGYYPPEDYVRYVPSNYGIWWRQNQGGLDWYTWMYNGRLPAHDDFLKFIKETGDAEGPVRSVLEFGCGLAVGYADAFSQIRYVGIDLSEKEIAWCREHRLNPLHEYIAADFIRDPPLEKFDVVFSQGTIDNSYDMDAYLRSMVACSKRWIYATAYRGWFPDLPEHRYVWDEGTTCFYNDISPRQVRETLQRLGCTGIEISPLAMENKDVPFETRIVARVPNP